jgi:hemerythrin-like domain-containing protein
MDQHWKEKYLADKEHWRQVTQMRVITRPEIKDKTKAEALVEKRLDEMGIGEMEDGAELRAAAKAYYLELLQEHLDLSDEVLFNEYFDDSEGMVWGFVAGYQACLRNYS